MLGYACLVTRMECPPTKRLKGLNYGAPSTTDSFGDDGDFTQDDLDEIDIIASQAFTGDVGVKGPKETFGAVYPLPGAQRKPVPEGRKASALSGSSNPGQSNMGSIYQLPTVEVFGNVQQQFKKNKDDLSYGNLEAQQAELKKKLKEVEDKLLMKDGEIRVLRDSIRHAQQEKEQERQSQLLQEKERAHIQSEKEKELLKKVKSLQSELHFKEAEMNEIKTKLQNSERGSKRVVSSTARNSPRRCSPAALQQDGSGGSGVSPGVSPFLTKESFAAQLSSRASPATADRVSHFGAGGRPVSEANNSVSNDSKFRKQGFTGPDACSCQEWILLNLLLQHPLDPSTLGLSHLLCLSPETLPGLLMQHSYLSPGSSAGSSGSSEPKAVQQLQSGFSQAQSLAMSGLSMLALRHHTPSAGGEDGQAASQRCPGAVHLLPLLEHHVGLFCQALEAADSPGRSPLRGSSVSGSSSEGSVASSLEESLVGLEEFALAALRALYHLLSHSTQAVHALLSHHAPGLPETDRAAARPACSQAPADPQGAPSQHPLLRRLLQLADPAFTSPACQREKVLSASLMALNVLAERAGDQLRCRMKLVVTSPFAARCLSLDSSYRTVSLSVSLLAVAASDEEVASLLCSHLEPCPLLKMFQYVTTRPDKSVTESQWSHLELEVTRFLTMLFTQRTSTWLAFIESSCQCNNEVVRTLVVLLHRQWLKARRWEYQEGRSQAWAGPGLQLLREAMTLLHWLLLNDASFSEHCLDVLHMYDQVFPAIRDTFRKIPCLTESEELALEEISRPEVEDAEDMDIDTGS
ncbi:ATR-interacting protein isoform X2 [Anguilla anguilla]|uniref:ATR-interacting protein isoform X2 n=1 Tax=Anguilla anguilla TaxID=7936 RepID=UPI0015AEA94E|nr:ATR-interacting protein isoform X2 [Anguilla anguilla]